MATNLFSWLKQSLFGQISCQRCLQLLELITDGEASPEEEKQFRSHIDECLPCYESFNLEQSIKEMLQTKLDKKQVPEDLVNLIKRKIRDTA
jgi:anti-sigma factor (TIGR02949 family)